MFHVQGALFEDQFGTETTRALFSEGQYITRFMEVEAALARVQADLGLIPESAAEEITQTATVETLDYDLLEETVEEIGLFTMSIIDTWRDAIGDSGEFIHWGATSQDIADTTMVLLVREAISVMRDRLNTIEGHLVDLADRYATTPMIGRTHHVHAIPTTFGLKVATWLDEIRRGIQRIDDLAERVYVVEFFGAVGTLASLGEEGIAVQEGLADELDLDVPNTAWHASRDRSAEVLSAFSILAGTLAKIARQVLLLGRDEIAEVREHVGAGKVGSSTMPHKKNPVKSERVVGLAAMIRGQASVMHQALEAYDERDAGLWYIEFSVLPMACMYLDRALQNVVEILESLSVEPDRLDENLHIHDGLVASEAVMMAYADHVGRQRAHEVIYDIAMDTIASEGDFATHLKASDEVSEVLTESDIDRLTDPRRYIGVADRLVDRVVHDER